jgi:phosphoglycerate dehydrogenase-like enzyme
MLPDEPLAREEAELTSARSQDARDLPDLTTDHVLLRMPDAVATPHSAYPIREATRRLVATSTENIAAFARGKPCYSASPPAVVQI